MISCANVSTHEFTSNDPNVWSDSRALGPVWLQNVAGRLTWDRPVTMGLARFLFSVEEMARGFNFAYGTAYATILGDGEVTAGPLHYDSGRWMPERDHLRFTATWSSDDANLANAFRSGRNRQAEQSLEGTIYRPGLPNFYLPANRHVVMFSEGLDLHARVAVPARPGEWGVFCSASLYLADDEADLYCPKLNLLRARVPEAVRVLGQQTRERY